MKQKLEAHAAACRTTLAAGEPRPALPAELQDLRRANLEGANLRGAILKKTVKVNIISAMTPKCSDCHAPLAGRLVIDGRCSDCTPHPEIAVSSREPERWVMEPFRSRDGEHKAVGVDPVRVGWPTFEDE
ncbi:MAG: pentapeptide repeat-containing protein [Actinomycetota bacterium]|nr:pentapeptide repeat-containing protein [Actinomycetota bacterium]